MCFDLKISPIRSIVTRISRCHWKIKMSETHKQVVLIEDTEYEMLLPVSSNPEYVVWSQMIQRCINPTYTNYKYYGGRGIVVCEPWRRSFKKFFKDMGPRPSLKYSIDRIDVNGNYEPSNCRWLLKAKQNQNRRPKSTSRSGVSGVYPDRYLTVKGEERIYGWCAVIERDKHRHFLGQFDTKEEAIAARLAGERMYSSMQEANLYLDPCG